MRSPSNQRNKDPNRRKYEARYGLGAGCWEPDALRPDTLTQLVVETIERHRNESAWQESTKVKAEHRATLQRMAGRYEDVAPFVRTGDCD